MATDQSLGQPGLSAGEAQLARFEATGLGGHRHAVALAQAAGPHSGRDLADAIHLLCSLHGRYPGLIELALTHCTDQRARPWLSEAADTFERERLYLVRLTAAVGPVPSTPGAAETEASLLSQRHALETLASSERCGCPLGAATALVADWRQIRHVLDRSATRVGIDCAPCALPAQEAIADVIEAIAGTPSTERAIAFGAEQLLLQHRALFDLLEARSEARVGY